MALISREHHFRACPVAAALRMCDDFHMGLTVLVVDDHPAFRASARRLLELDGFEVVAEAADGESGLRLAGEFEPDIVLLDVGLPDRSGFAVAEELAGKTTAVVLVSSRSPGELGRRVRDTGALGFIPKEQLSGEAIHALLGSAA